MHADLACPALPGSAGLTAARPGRPVWIAIASVGLAGAALAAAVLVRPLPSGWPPALDGPLRLGVAALIGLAVTAVQRRGERTAPAQAVQHAQILLCVSGAMMMVLIDD